MKAMRLVDFAAYVAIGLVLVAALYWLSLHSEWDPDLLGRWGGLAATTLILFGYALREHWHHRFRRSFWVVGGALLLIHVLVFWVILVNVEGWKVLRFVLAYPFENLAVDAAFAATGHRRISKGNARRMG